jgi:hypothetical protein
MPELWYDHAVINLAAGNPDLALAALKKCLELNPKLKVQAMADSDLKGLHSNDLFKKLIEKDD